MPIKASIRSSILMMQVNHTTGHVKTRDCIKVTLITGTDIRKYEKVIHINTMVVINIRVIITEDIATITT